MTTTVITPTLREQRRQSRRIDTGIDDPAELRRQIRTLTESNNRLRELNRELTNAMQKTETARRERARKDDALAIYGESEEVKSLTKRLDYLLPNAQEIGSQGVALVAQTAIAHGLDPLPGSDHLYAWKQGKNLHVVIGYKGLLHLARQQVYFTHHSRVMTDAERSERALDDKQIGYVTEVYEIEKAKECKDLGIPYHPIVGTAIWKPGDSVPASRDKHWVAKKNSLKDALRQITSTGTRLGKFLDTMYAESSRAAQAALAAPVQGTGDGWVIELPDEVDDDDPETVKQELIDAGIIKADDDDDGAEPQPLTLEQTPDTDDGEPWDVPTCIRCQEAAAEPNEFDSGMCLKCANATIDEMAAQDS